MVKNVIIIAVLLTALLPNLVYAEGQAETILKADQALAAGQIDFAFMHYRNILNNSSNLKYQNAAIFASGEYYFMIADYEDARQHFTNYLKSNSNSNSKLFALMYLWKIAKIKNEEATTEELEKQIMTFEKRSFIFRNFKEQKYESPLDRDHKAVFSIDKIAFYVEGGLFEEISY